LLCNVATIGVNAVAQRTAFLLKEAVLAADENAFVEFVIAFEECLEVLVADAFTRKTVNLMKFDSADSVSGRLLVRLSGHEAMLRWPIDTQVNISIDSNNVVAFAAGSPDSIGRAGG
jgi:hypothetical protein